MYKYMVRWGFPGGTNGEEAACQCGKQEKQVWSLGQEDLEEGMATHSSVNCLQNPMDREAWQATVHRVEKSWTQLKQLGTRARGYLYILYSIHYTLHIYPYKEK